MNNRSANNNHSLPSIQEEYLENQLIFGKPGTRPKSVTYNSPHSFDEHIPKTGNPAVLHVTSTTSHHKSLSSSFESEDSRTGNDQCDKSAKEKERMKGMTEKISKQSLKHLDSWTKVWQYKIFFFEDMIGIDWIHYKSKPEVNKQQLS